MDTEQSQSSKNTIYIEKVWEDFSAKYYRVIFGWRVYQFSSYLVISNFQGFMFKKSYISFKMQSK